MANAAKALVLNDQAYVSPYLMRPLRRLDEVARSHDPADPAVEEKAPKAVRRRSTGSEEPAQQAAVARRG